MRQAVKALPTGILGTPFPLSEFISEPLAASADTSVYPVIDTPPDGDAPPWQPVQLVCIIGHMVMEKVTGLIVSHRTVHVSLSAP